MNSAAIALSGRPRKDAQPAQCYYQIRAFLVPRKEAIAREQQCSGRFILATNVLDAQELSNDDVLRDYIAQQSTLAGFSIPQRPAVFHIQCFPKLSANELRHWRWLWVCAYSFTAWGNEHYVKPWNERAQTIKNQLGKPTATPTMRWVFQCFMSIHLVTIALC